MYQNLNGVHGLAGWRWLYIICGVSLLLSKAISLLVWPLTGQCMTVPIGIATYIFLPDTPYTTRSWFLTQAERDLAEERVRKAGKAAPVKVTLNTFKKILSSWKWYAFVIGYVVSQSFPSGSGSHLPVKRKCLLTCHCRQALWGVVWWQWLFRNLVEGREVLRC